jgi:hypothetical protein
MKTAEGGTYDLNWKLETGNWKLTSGSLKLE